ncbi:hypothetical protein PP2015_2104 [Pseudoalteromonas phenolica]|uniref:Uncharacterized protein n=1 Tax=Pseudoalteromonas phenolica TaxID=161398 RepID=A0A0S2K277_9GAMM|nr:hypothetical protein PP2015_2104 [Pseudoalteromonas phenolica]
MLIQAANLNFIEIDNAKACLPLKFESYSNQMATRLRFTQAACLLKTFFKK